MAAYPRVRRLALALAVVAAFVFFVQEVVAPAAVRAIVKSLLRKQCPSCRFDLEAIRLRLLPISLSFSGVQFEAGSPETLQVSARCARLDAAVAPWALLRKSLRLGEIRLFKPQVTLIEGDQDSAASDITAATPAKPGGDVDVDGIEVEEGAFTYIRRHLNQDATLKLHGISVAIGPFGSSPERRNEKATGRALGQLENSGHFELSLAGVLFEKEQNLDVDLKIAQQNLADVNPYFEPGEGIRLGGVLVEGHGKMGIRGARGDVWVYAKYKGLNFDVRKTDDRSALSALLTNFLSSLVTRKDNRDKDWVDRTQEVKVEREAKESLVKFVLRGLKEAALKIPRH